MEITQKESNIVQSEFNMFEVNVDTLIEGTVLKWEDYFAEYSGKDINTYVSWLARDVLTFLELKVRQK